MFGIEIIEVGIGLVFAYLTISTICSGFVQAGIKLTNFRAKHLEISLRKLLASNSENKIVEQLYAHHLINGGTLNKLKKTDYIDAAHFAAAIVDCFIEASPKSEKFQAIRKAISDLPDQKLSKPLLKMLDESMEDVTEFKAKLAGWFDHNMEHATDWYRRKMRTFVTIAAFGVVFALNADSFSLATELWNDDDLRQTTVTAAEGYLKTKNEADIINLRTLTAVDSSGNLINPELYNAQRDSLSKVSFGELIGNIQAQVDSANRLPIGWGRDYDKVKQLWKKETPWTTFVWWWLTKFLGLMLTVGAVNMGAPYWFAQLKSLMNLRFNMMGGGNSNPPPAATPAPVPAPAPPQITAPVVAPVAPPVEDTPDTEMV